MSEKTTGAITITVPFTARETGFDFGDDIGSYQRLDERWLSVHRGYRELKIAERDIGKAVLAAWPGEAPTGGRPNISAIAARHKAIGEDRGGTPAMDIGEGWLAHEDRGDLLDEHRAASAALTAAGVPDDGRSLAERVDALAKLRDELRRDVARLSALKTAEVAPILDRFVERFAGPRVYSSGSEAAKALGLPPPEPDLEPAVGDEPRGE